MRSLKGDQAVRVAVDRVDLPNAADPCDFARNNYATNSCIHVPTSNHVKNEQRSFFAHCPEPANAATLKFVHDESQSSRRVWSRMSHPVGCLGDQDPTAIRAEAFQDGCVERPAIRLRPRGTNDGTGADRLGVELQI
jgi:hypothetical protein